MNMIQLECFLAVAENLNFARAAEQLHITQPAVTHQINSLETELGAKLFTRTTRSVELTPVGFSFISDAQNILGMANTAKTRIASHFPSQVSPFFIGCHVSADYVLLPPVIRELKKERPHFHPLIKRAPFPMLLNQIKEESIHVMFGFQNDQKDRKSSELFTFLTEAPICCIVSPKHPLAARDSVSLEELKTGGFIAVSPRRTSPSVASALSPLIGLRPPSDIYFCDDPVSMLTLVKAGLGFALYPSSPTSEESSLCYIPVENMPVMRFGLFFKNKKTHPDLGRFIQLMQQQF